LQKKERELRGWTCMESGRKNYKTCQRWKCCRKKAYKKTQDEMERCHGKRYKNDP